MVSTFHKHLYQILKQRLGGADSLDKCGYLLRRAGPTCEQRAGRTVGQSPQLCGVSGDRVAQLRDTALDPEGTGFLFPPLVGPEAAVRSRMPSARSQRTLSVSPRQALAHGILAHRRAAPMTISPSFKSAAGGYQPRGWRKIARRRTAAGSIFDSPRKRSGHLHCARVRGRGDATRNSCSATCPILTAKMATVQTELGSDFGSKIAFLSITIDPEHDTPDVLQRYARTFGADPAGWKFLTGSPVAIQDIERRYGVFASKSSDRELDHTNSDFAGRSPWHATRAISRCALRSGRVPPRSSGPRGEARAGQ